MTAEHSNNEVFCDLMTNNVFMFLSKMQTEQHDDAVQDRGFFCDFLFGSSFGQRIATLQSFASIKYWMPHVT